MFRVSSVAAVSSSGEYAHQRCRHRHQAIDSVRDFGMYIDSRLDMRVHISKTPSICIFYLRRLRHLRRTVDRDVRQRLVSGMILSRIDNFNALLVGYIGLLRRVMNAAVDFLAGLEHVTIPAMLTESSTGFRLTSVSTKN
jgi:hypothetical protein